MLGRSSSIFEEDINERAIEIEQLVSNGKFLVIGGAGSIGQAVVREIFKREPKLLHVVDISENNLVELVRDIRSSLGYIKGDFRTFALDCGGREFEVLVKAEGPYDYVLNLSALKHVRSEKDSYTLMRMIDINIFNTIKVLELTKGDLKKYFSVSTDKATKPVNMMGASKRIMEVFLMRESVNNKISTARFANVAFSDGSLLYGFTQRILKKQPIAAPNDIKRYFLTPQESGELCLISCLFGENKDIYIPKIGDKLTPKTFSEMANSYIKEMGYEPVECSSEDNARMSINWLIENKKWPCYYFKSDTTGEKEIEEFYSENQIVDYSQYKKIGVIKNELDFDSKLIDEFIRDINIIRNKEVWSRSEIILAFKKILSDFEHNEKGKFLDEKM